MKILITGGNGYIAKSLYANLHTKYDVTTITRNDFDLTNRTATDMYFQDKQFDFVIHTAIKGGSRLREDSVDVTHINLSMFYNLWNNKHKFKRLISFGSGAEDGMPAQPYGLSKHVISNLINTIPYFYNVRIFGVFDENELETRFIKSNIQRYINKQNIIIHEDKHMDFFYMKDLVNVIEYYLKLNSPFEPPQTTFNCCYETTYKLSEIANLINNLSDYKVNIQIQSDKLGTSYKGVFDAPIIENTNIPIIKYTGIEAGIREVFEKLRK
jgi:GDP-L-fucose synthase